MKSFFELLGKAMQTNGMTLRLCLLMLVAAAAYFISQLGDRVWSERRPTTGDHGDREPR